MTVVRRRLLSAALSTALSTPILMGWAAAASFSPDARADGTDLPLGIPGKDVIFLPTASSLVDVMLDLAHVTAKDTLIDLGSGDGRLVITAAQRGASAHGIEYNPDLVERAKSNAAASGVAARASFEKADIFESDFSKASVITLFLLPELNLRLRPTLLKMKPGTRIASNTFDMGDWKPDRTAKVQDRCQTYCNALLWIVPAPVQGSWRLGERELVLEQNFQELQGQLREGGRSWPIAEARMDGISIRFEADGKRYVGEVDGARMVGTVTGTADGSRWTASRP